MIKCDKRAFSRCKYRGNCGPDAEYTGGSECDKFNKIVLERPMTNADRIRSMSDEEMADQLVIKIDGLAMCSLYLSAPVGRMFISRKDASRETLDWLRQPAEED